MNSRFFHFSQLEDYLSGLGMFHMRLGLSRMQAAQNRLELDHPCPALAQVVGTNGKGSTAYFLSEIAQAHGLRSGLFTSPHFLSFRERIRCNGSIARPEQVLEWANHVQGHVQDMDLTYFELVTLIAVHGFHCSALDMVVLEAGLGGRNDATTTWSPDVLLLTPIGMDHEHIIGPDLEQIALDKAGAIKGGGLVVTGPQTAEVMQVLAQETGRRNARLVTVEELLDNLSEPAEAAPGLAGRHQVDNSRLALAGWAALCTLKGWKLDVSACRTAISSSSWPGRLQRIAGSPEIILDAAHNGPAFQALAQALQGLDMRPGALVFNCMQDKNLKVMAPLVRQLTSGPIFVPELPMYERARPARDTVAFLGQAAQPVGDAATALARASLTGRPALVCGSLYLLAEIYRQHPHWLEPQDIRLKSRQPASSVASGARHV